MNIPQVLVLTALLLANGISCNGSKKSGSSELDARLKAVDYDSVLITLERTACFGACPVYTVTIDGQGNVVWEGKENVKVVGKQEYKIPQEKAQELVKAFYQMDYFSLQDSYFEKTTEQKSGEGGTQMVTSTVTDLPTTNTSITVNGQTKKVSNYYGGPEQLAELEKLIDQTCQTSRYIGG